MCRFTAFQIEVRTHSGLTWTVDHRYRQFLALNKVDAREFPPLVLCAPHSPVVLQALVSRFSSLRDFKFPPKKWFSSFTTNTVERRRQQFEQYLQELVRALVWFQLVCVARCQFCRRVRVFIFQLSLQPRPLEVNQFLEITSHLYGNGEWVVHPWRLLSSW
jgi:PX domain